ncbi:NERD domain-containing protein [Gracilibacillus sp. YIM 98692]|uniref:NERD domain-containing protein n=1 Tax=Gracilibacillus sp. YIM 98692 TaxID=2663532 RepID=UPI0013D37DAA|nr:NERD domain-containing protein [Gracilibacillus sp. YIM 98692]
MAQLIKLDNYISRYEQDLYHYPSQFSRLKKQNWQNLKKKWESNDFTNTNSTMESDEYVSKWHWKNFFFKKEQEEMGNDEQVLPNSEAHLKQFYLDMLFPFQLKWASTTLKRKSFLDRKYSDDFRLRYLLQRIPDNHLVMYLPVFQLKHQPMDGEIMLISPVGVEIITFLERFDNQTFIAGDDRGWFVEENNIRTKILSPLISLKRTEKVVRSIFKKAGLEFPIQKIVLSRSNHIDFQQEAYQTRYVGVEEHLTWLKEKQNLLSPIKRRQLQAANHLLSYCETVSVQRSEWDEESQPFV